MTALACPRCGWNHWPSTNPAELDAWRCCTPAQTLPDIDGYLDPPTPEAPTTASLVGPTRDGASPAPSGVAQLDERSRAEVEDGAMAAAWVFACFSLVALGFAVLVVREVVSRIGGA